jgi:circadian clock protein KaiC
MVGEYTAAETPSRPEFAVADGILQLENEAHGPIDRRWLRVLKMRGADVAAGQHSFRIGGGGFELFPRLETTLPERVKTLETRASFGLEKLDEAIGGGIPRGDSTLVIGPSGVGKTLLALRFLAAGLGQGERCLHISFQESEAQVKEKAAAVGWDWRDVGEDQLVVRHIPPVELDLDEVGGLIRNELARGEVKRVVVDSLAELAFAARETERLPAYIWALGGFVRAAGGTTIFTNEMAALGRGADLGGLSFIFNNVFFLRYIEIQSELRRGLNVLKMRQSGHEKGLVSFGIDGGGITFGERIEGLSGMLGWSALRGEESP